MAIPFLLPLAGLLGTAVGGYRTGSPEKLRKVQEEFESGDRNLLEYAVGTGYAGVGEPLTNVAGMPFEALDAGLSLIPGYETAKGAVGEAAGEAYRAVGGEEAEQYIEENIPPEYRRFATELIGTLGVGSLGRSVIGRDDNRPDAMKGAALASGNVIKKGHYNPDDLELNRLEKAVGSLGGMLDPRTRQKIEGGYKQKIKGNLEFLRSGLGRVAQLAFNPVARAKYAELGLSPVFDTVYKKYQKALAMPPGKERKQAIESAVEEVSSQLQQMQHIRQQAGAVAKGKDATMPFALASADEFVPEMYFSPPEMGHNWVAKANANAPTPRPVSKGDYEIIQNHMRNAWSGDGYDPNTTKIIVKSPRSKVTGNHFNDVIANNEVMTSIANMFQVKSTKGGKQSRSLKQFDSVADLKAALSKLQEDTRWYKEKDGKREPKIDPVTGEQYKYPFSIRYTTDDGVWIEMSKAGTAKVEGGVNMLIKVEPNGDLTGVMSDLHNFWEQKTIKGVKVRNYPMKWALPNEVLAMTRPMQSNVVSISGVAGKVPKPSQKRVTLDEEGLTLGKFGREAEERRISQAESAPLPETGRQAAAEKRIQETGMLTPSRGEVLRQSVPVAQNVALTGGMLSQTPEEEQK